MSTQTQQNSNVLFVRDPDFNHIEARFSHYNQSTFKKHFHDTYAIGVVEQGISSFFYRDTVKSIREGDISLINPGEVHACNPSPNSVLVYRMFYVNTELIQEITFDISGKHQGLPYFREAIVQDSQLYHSLIKLYTTLSESESKLEKDSLIHEVLSQLILRYSDQQEHIELPEKPFKAIQRAHEYLMEHLSQNTPLYTLSSVAGLSAYHLLRVFRDHFGLPPHAFQIQQRINLAQKMLADGVPIVQVALEVGFSDQSHFTKKFKSLVGATPRQYQIAHR